MAQKGPRLNDLDEPEYRGNPRGRIASGWLDKARKHLLPVAIGGAVILFALIMLVFWGGSGEDQNAAREGSDKESLEARLNKLEFQHSMILEQMNKIQESSSSGIRQQELAKLRKAVSDLEARFAGLEDRLAERLEVADREDEGDGGSREGTKRHTVQEGETLFRLSQRYDVSVEELREWNDIEEGEFIQPGQELKVAQ
ncbi:MAG: LysM peptidoglycan-binding domain-containing protein [Desulfohalobiaceae bacterium]|nr:LysM peptidoglycan-binding domain-containing protein [Desulfohalobiaceae bacterium]